MSSSQGYVEEISGQLYIHTCVEKISAKIETSKLERKSRIFRYNSLPKIRECKKASNYITINQPQNSTPTFSTTQSRAYHGQAIETQIVTQHVAHTHVRVIKSTASIRHVYRDKNEFSICHIVDRSPPLFDPSTSILITTLVRN